MPTPEHFEIYSLGIMFGFNVSHGILPFSVGTDTCSAATHLVQTRCGQISTADTA